MPSWWDCMPAIVRQQQIQLSQFKVRSILCIKRHAKSQYHTLCTGTYVWLWGCRCILYLPVLYIHMTEDHSNGENLEPDSLHANKHKMMNKQLMHQNTNKSCPILDWLQIMPWQWDHWDPQWLVSHCSQVGPVPGSTWPSLHHMSLPYHSTLVC